MGMVSRARQEAGQTAQQAKPWVIQMARLGFAVKGVVYFIMGILVFEAAQGSQSPNISQKDVLARIIAAPFGNILMIIVTAGLFAYALWRLIQAIFDPEHLGTRGKQILQRVAYFISGLIYGSLGFTAYQMVSGKSSGGSSGGTQSFASKLISGQSGQTPVGLIGVVIIAIGLYAFYQAYSTNFQKQYPISRMRPDQKRLAILAGRIGIAARGIVFIALGVFLFQASASHTAGAPTGLGPAFQTLAQQPYGLVILAVVGLGLIAYAIYMIVFARYGRIMNSYG